MKFWSDANDSKSLAISILQHLNTIVTHKNVGVKFHYIFLRIEVVESNFGNLLLICRGN